MEEQAKSYNPDGSVWVKDHSGVYQHGRPGMQGVKAYAAPSRLKNGSSQQVVQIYGHGQEHEQPCLHPYGSEENIRQQGRS